MSHTCSSRCARMRVPRIANGRRTRLPLAAQVAAPQWSRSRGRRSGLTSRARYEAALFTGRSKTITIRTGGKGLRAKQPETKSIFPSRYTSGIFGLYYRVEISLPVLRDRALVLRRYPDGIKARLSFKKDCGKGCAWFTTVPMIGKKGEAIQDLRQPPTGASVSF